MEGEGALSDLPTFENIVKGCMLSYDHFFDFDRVEALSTTPILRRAQGGRAGARHLALAVLFDEDAPTLVERMLGLGAEVAVDKEGNTPLLDCAPRPRTARACCSSTAPTSSGATSTTTTRRSTRGRSCQRPRDDDRGVARAAGRRAAPTAPRWWTRSGERSTSTRVSDAACAQGKRGRRRRRASPTCTPSTTRGTPTTPTRPSRSRAALALRRREDGAPRHVSRGAAVRPGVSGRVSRRMEGGAVI